MKNRVLKCAISYSHKDRPMRQMFYDHLNGISRTHPLDIWCDMKIAAGKDVDKAIKEHFTNSDIIFLLVSTDFVNSTYCFENELKIAMERHNRNECLVVPVILSEVANIDQLPFGSIQRVPADGIPIKSRKPYQRGFNDADQMIIEMIDNLYKNETMNKSSRAQLNPKTKKRATKSTEKNTTRKPIKRKSSVVKYNIVKDGELKSIAIPQTVIDKLPDYHLSTVKFVQKMEEIVSNSIEDYKESSKSFPQKKAYADKRRLRLFRTFLFETANTVADCFVGTYNTRVHFRRLIDNKYKGLVVSGGRNVAAKASDLTEMPCNDGMIYISGRLGYPLIRSYNEMHHMIGQNDDIWIEHLTCTFKEEINGQGAPFLSMGISLNKVTSKTYKNVLRIMAYTRLDLTVGHYIERFINHCKQEDPDFILSDIMAKPF